MSSGIIESPGGKRGTDNDAVPKDTVDLLAPAQERTGPLTIDDVQQRLRIAFGIVDGVDDSVAHAMVSATEYADAWEEKQKTAGNSPTMEQYEKVIEKRYAISLARLEIERKNVADGHRELFAGRTREDTEEELVIDRKGEIIVTRPRKRWEFSKSLLRAVLDPRIPDNALKNFTHDGEAPEGGGQGVVKKYPGRNLATKSSNALAREDDDHLSRVDREVRTLVHMHIEAPEVSPNVLGEGRDNGHRVIFMEKAPGKTVEAQMPQLRNLGMMEKIELAKKLIDLMRRTHAAGVLHRDIKGANIMYDEISEICSLLDFGVARFRRNDTSSNRPKNETRTRAGQVLGTIKYIAPKQARDSSVPDPRNDLYALGLLLYELLSRIAARVFDSDDTDGFGKLAEIQTPGYEDDLPALHRNARNMDGTVAKKLPVKAALAIEVLLGKQPILDGVRQSAITVSLDDAGSRPQPAQTNDVPSSHGTLAVKQAADTVGADTPPPQAQATVEYVPKATGEAATIDVHPVSMETPEERKAWAEADAMAARALAYLDEVLAGEGDDFVLDTKRQVNRHLNNAKNFAKKPWMVALEIFAVLSVIVGGLAYFSSRKTPDASEVVVRPAEEPDQEHFNISSVGYKDGSEALVLQMPGEEPDILQNGVNFWQKGPDGSLVWIGGSTAMPNASLSKYVGDFASKRTPEFKRLFHVQLPNSRRKFMWGSGGISGFRPEAGKTRVGYGINSKDLPIITKAEKSGEWLLGMLADPDVQDFLLSIRLEDISVGKMSTEPFDAAGIDALSKEKNLRIFLANLKHNQETIGKLRNLQKEKAGAPKKSAMIPQDLLKPFGHQEKMASTPRRQLSAVQVREYKNRMNTA